MCSISKAKKIRCGVPQGSNLGPLLFLIYINDLPNCLETTQASMFADDTNISCHGISPTDIEHKLNNDLENVYKWLTSNKLTLNRKKTEFMTIGSRQKLNLMPSNPHILIGDQRINQVQNKKVLGVIIDDQLKWHDHNDAQCKKISKAIALLRRAKPFSTQETLLRMYKSLILPHFTYCSTVWHDGNNSQIIKLQKLQKRAARVITSSSYDIRSAQIFENLKWEPIDATFTNREQIMTFKALQSMVPPYLSELFTTNNNNTYGLRSNNRKLYLDKPNTNFLKRSFSYRGAMSWNSLPLEIVDNYQDLSIKSFKRLLGNYNGIQ